MLSVATAVVLSLAVAGVVYNRLTITKLKRKLDAYDRLLQLSQRPQDDDGDGHPPNLRLIQGGVVAGTTALVLQWTREHPKASALVALATVASALGLAASAPPPSHHHPRGPVALPPAISAVPAPPVSLPNWPAAPVPAPAPAAPSVTPPRTPLPVAAVPINYPGRPLLPTPQRPPTSPSLTPARPTTPPGDTSTPLPGTLPPECSGIRLDIPALLDACLLG